MIDVDMRYQHWNGYTLLEWVSDSKIDDQIESGGTREVTILPPHKINFEMGHNIGHPFQNRWPILWACSGNLYTWEGGVQYLDESGKPHGNLCWKTIDSLLLAEASLLGIETEICMVQFFLTTQLLVDLTSH